jgi:hypothetical protein
MTGRYTCTKHEQPESVLATFLYNFRRDSGVILGGVDVVELCEFLHQRGGRNLQFIAEAGELVG